ncbi:hypothetical protein DFH09DRAFT_1095061 [Mycena vulgaris]|nr:hypothetical protein DFH09DRAFT_1095061 [Mycena vulgaris]
MHYKPLAGWLITHLKPSQGLGGMDSGIENPLSSPTRATDELLELTQQMTPSKPPEVLRRIQIRRDIQSPSFADPMAPKAFSVARQSDRLPGQSRKCTRSNGRLLAQSSILAASESYIAFIFAIWLHSADTQLSKIGDETGLNYREPDQPGTKQMKTTTIFQPCPGDSSYHAYKHFFLGS